jgi:hypothetical protein
LHPSLKHCQKGILGGSFCCCTLQKYSFLITFKNQVITIFLIHRHQQFLM